MADKLFRFAALAMIVLLTAVARIVSVSTSNACFIPYPLKQRSFLLQLCTVQTPAVLWVDRTVKGRMVNPSPCCMVRTVNL